MAEKIKISIVIPVFNEEGSIKALYNELTNVLKRTGKSYEFVFVDDGSEDDTFSELKKLRKNDKKVKMIAFTRNFKKASALAAGLKSASGEMIITMDGDLQDNPHEIPKLLGHMQKGFDMVVGWKYPRKDPMHKVVSSRIFNFLVRIMTKLRIHDCDSNFRAMKRKVVPHLELYSGLYRYIPLIAQQKGFDVGEVKVRHRPRTHGKSKYKSTRLFTGFLDLITIKFLLDYYKRPLHLFGGIGIFFMSFGLVTGIYLLYVRLILNVLIGQRPLLILTILLIFLGVQFISIGLVGEMIANANQIKGDQYSIKEEHGFNRGR